MSTEKKEEVRRYGTQHTCLVNLDGSWLQLDSSCLASAVRDKLNSHLVEAESYKAVISVALDEFGELSALKNSCLHDQYEALKSQLAQLTRENKALREAAKQACYLIDCHIYERDCELSSVAVNGDLESALAMGKEK